MNKAIGSVGTVVLTFFVTLILNTSLNYYTRDRGSISISDPVGIGESIATIITIENHSAETLNGLIIEAPYSIQTSSISARPSVAIEEIPSIAKGGSRLIRISQISPRQISRIFIPHPSGEQTITIRISNIEETGLKSRHDDRLDSPLLFAFYSALFVALLYALVESASLYISAKERNSLNKRIDDLEKSSGELNGLREKFRKDLDAVNTRLAKQRLLLQARLFDYSKELSFWRNVMKTLILQSGGDNRQVDALISQVTSSLGTHGTKASTTESFEAIKVASRWLADAEGNPASQADNEEH